MKKIFAIAIVAFLCNGFLKAQVIQSDNTWKVYDDNSTTINTSYVATGNFDLNWNNSVFYNFSTANGGSACGNPYSSQFNPALTMWADNSTTTGVQGIGANNNDYVYFRKHFTLSNPSGLSTGSINFTVNDVGTVYVNGNALSPSGSYGTWSTYALSSFSRYLICGDNVITIAARNNTSSTCWWVYFDMSLTGACVVGNNSCTTANTVPKVDPSNTSNLTCSEITDNGTTVGVATSSASPTYYLTSGGSAINNSKLYVDMSLTGPTYPAWAGIMLKGNTSTNNYPTFSFGMNNSSSQTILGATLEGAITSSTAGAETMDMTFFTKPSSSQISEKMRITSAGLVGIGTSTPHAALDVNGTALFLEGGSGGYLTGAGSGINLHYDVGSDFGTIYAFNYGASAVKNLILQEPGGYVGIGLTTQPTAQLHTTGTVRFAGLVGGTAVNTVVADGNGYLYVQSGLPVSTTCGTAHMVPVMSGTNTEICSEIYDNGTSVGISTTSPRTYTGSGSVEGPAPANPTLSKLDINGLTFTNSLVVSSDGRFKKNIQKVDNALATVLKLNGVSYDWNKEGFKDRNFDNFKQAGFIAQDVEKVYPVAVLKDNEGYYAMNYNAMLPLLTEAIKDLNVKVEENATLRAALDNTNATIVALQNQINDLCNGGCASLKGSSGNADQSNQLLQNIPNPFSQQTTIGYVINVGTVAYMNINSLDGKQIKHLPLTVGGTGSVTISSSDLAPGTYTYTLVVDTKVVDTKIMVITAQD